MADITHNDPVVTESKLTEFYNDIKPFLGCPAYITQEGDSEYYSTDEKVIGRWIDGKPLYQKTIKNTSLTVIAKSTWTTYANVSSLHIDSLVGTSFGRLTSGGNKEDDMSDVCFWTDGTNLQANSRGEGTNTPNGSVVTIKYTKITDSAVTTVDQDPNKYSTEEKIIGEWIDGKPLYQKTIVGTTAATAYGWVQIPIGANIDFSMLKDLTILAGGAGVAANATVDFFYPSVGEDLSTYARAVIWTDREASASKNCFGVYTKFNGSVPFYATIQYTKVSD